MKVKRSEFKSVVAYLMTSQPDFLALDTETTGLDAFNGDEVFSIIISDETKDFYFSFNENTPEEYKLDRSQMLDLQVALHACPIFMHNAKFDMHMLTKEGFDFRTVDVICTEALARVVRNDLMSYSLDNLAKKYLNTQKLGDVVKEYMTKNKCFTWVQPAGSPKRKKNFHYDQVPFELMSSYGEVDGRLTYDLGVLLLEKLDAIAVSTPSGLPTVKNVFETEKALTKVLFKMEQTGIKIDLKYTQEALVHEQENIKRIVNEFETMTGVPFNDGRKTLVKVFDQFGLAYPTTDKGNPSFKSDVLQKIEHDVCDLILEYRSAYKSAYTYFENFIQLSDHNNVIHTNFRQSGTTTGRLSCANPNLQNVPKTQAKGKFKARQCFVPRAGFFFLMIDYDQLEYRLIMDYAGEMGVIKKVLEDGLDVHTATAEISGEERHVAKQVNFLTIYGGGNGKLAEYLKTTVEAATRIRNKILGSIPKIRSFVKGVIQTAKTRKYVFNWTGRRCHIQDSNFAYKAPNHLIQGGASDVVKRAMVTLDEYLEPYRSRMLLNVHDEIVFELAYGEEEIIPELKRIMETAYPHKHLPLTAGCDFSKDNWNAKEAYA